MVNFLDALVFSEFSVQFEDGAVSSASEPGAKVEAVQNDFQIAVQETVKATGLEADHFEWNERKPYSQVSFEPGKYRSTGYGGTAQDGYNFPQTLTPFLPPHELFHLRAILGGREERDL